MTSDTKLIQRIRELSSPRQPIETGMEPAIHPIENIRVVLFDVYGTLVVSGSGDIGTTAKTNTAEVFLESLEASGITGAEDTENLGRTGIEMYLEAIRHEHQRLREKGITSPEIDVRETWKKVFQELHDADLVNDVPDAERIKRFAIEYESRVNPTWTMPRATETLDALSKSVTLGIVSNAQFFTPLLFPALMGRTLEQFSFDAELCYFSYAYRQAKPSTTLFTKALAKLDERGIPPEQIVYVGNDMLNDVYPARKLGIRTVLFAGDKRSLRLRDDQLDPGVKPDAIVTDLSQLLKVLGM